ncbi:MAG: IS110 family transposase [Eggerthellaceae bacterium]
MKKASEADATPENSLVGMEATGRYWVALFDFLSSHGYEAAVINPSRPTPSATSGRSQGQDRRP